ncbi:MAG: DUF167 family protein [Candidatus Aenigmatarchaeota archaeon]
MKERTIIQRDGETLLNIRVKPNSNCFEILGINEWDNRLHIKLKSPAKDNQANKELLKEMKEILDEEVKLFSGKTSRKKTILIRNIGEENIKDKLNI